MISSSTVSPSARQLGVHVKVGLVEDVAVTLTALLHVGAVIPSHATERANTLASTASSRLRVFIITSNEKGLP
jgi:hypothetical protein